MIEILKRVHSHYRLAPVGGKIDNWEEALERELRGCEI
jgi:hypothetical protein